MLISKVRTSGLLLVAVVTTAFGQDQPVQVSPEHSSPADTFVAPFTTLGFLQAVHEESERRRLYLELTTGIYLQEKRRLVWSTRDNGDDIDWRRAGDYCDELELAGFDDWRLPSLQELQTLLQPLARKQYSTPNQIQLTACCPWSTTRKSDTSAWNFNFRFRKPFSSSITLTYDLRALCVRDWLEADGLPVEPREEETATTPDSR